MSYLVLARKWRPQTFHDVVAQKHAIQALQNAIRLKRLPHALLLCGSRGIGKTTIARLVAKTINCEQRDLDDENAPAEPCNKCSMCTEITSGRSVDVLEIDGASNRSIDDIRSLRENVQYPPTRGNRKVYIIDEVHMLTREAFNALLKTLEEPPEHVLFIFATTEPHKIPITILSRCQRFDLKRISLGAMSQYLGELASNEGLHLSDAALMMITRAADGGMRDALSLMDQVIAFGGASPSDEDVSQAIGALDRTLLLDIGRALLERDINAILHHIEELFSYAYDLRQLTQELAGLLRDLMVARICNNPEEVIDLASTELEAIKQLAANEAPERIQQMFRLLTTAAEDIAHASHPRLILEMTLIQMARVEPVRPFDEILLQLNGLEAQLQQAEGPSSQSPPPNIQQAEGPSSQSPPPNKEEKNNPKSGEPLPAENWKRAETKPAPQQTNKLSFPKPKPEPKKLEPAPLPIQEVPTVSTPHTPPPTNSTRHNFSAFSEKLNASLNAPNPPKAQKKQETEPIKPEKSEPKPSTPPPPVQTNKPAAKAKPKQKKQAPTEFDHNEFSKLKGTPPPYDPNGELTPPQWEFLVEGISQSKQFLSGPLQVVRFRTVEPGRVLLVFQSNQGLHCDTLSRPENQNFVESFFADKGFPIKLDMQIHDLREDEEEVFHLCVTDIRKRRYTALVDKLRQETHEYPQVKQLLKLFPGTEIVEVTPLAQEELPTQDEG